ncbi:MAG: diaminopropionate ammonia-lyase [Elainellaceae cyanobacterium]
MNHQSIFTSHSAEIYTNSHADRHSSYSLEKQQILNRQRAALAIQEISAWDGYHVTPLRSLSSLSQFLNVETIWYKDESERFGLGSFKALGGAYAVFRQLAQQIHLRAGVDCVTASDLFSGQYADLTSEITVTTATDGNHGRSVAWGAQQFGCRCVIYIHAGVSIGREQAIAAYGAEIRRVPGNYDDSVRQAAIEANKYGWILVADTSDANYRDIACDVMQGYTVMVEEVMQQLPASMPTHIFVQAGVGGLAAAVCAHIWEIWGTKRPTFVVVEPNRADCLYQSARQGRLVELKGNIATLMACLSAGVPSLLAWEILQSGADFFVTIPDAAAASAMKQLAELGIIAGESGAAGIAALIAIAQQPEQRQQLGINERSQILTFGTEGATDLEIYRQITNRG